MFLVPLAALARAAVPRGRSSAARGLVVRLGPLLALQLLPLDRGVLHADALPRRRASLLGLLGRAGEAARGSPRRCSPLAGAYGVGAVVVSPFLYYALSDYQGVITPATHNPADLVNVRVPDRGRRRSAAGLAQHFVPSRPGDLGRERAVPRAAAARDRRALRARAVAAAGQPLPRARAAPRRASRRSARELRVRDHALFPLPWRLVRDAPLFDNVIPARFAALRRARREPDRGALGGVAGRSRPLRIVLTAAAVAALVPNRLGTATGTSTRRGPRSSRRSSTGSCLARRQRARAAAAVPERRRSSGRPRAASASGSPTARSTTPSRTSLPRPRGDAAS